MKSHVQNKKTNDIESENSSIIPIPVSPETHIVFVTDENGITSTFQQIKIILADPTEQFITLVYSVNQKQKTVLFQAELKSIEKRFSNLLELHFLKTGKKFFTGSFEKHQKVLEVVINSNIKPVIKFVVDGREELISVASECLYFLGIKENQIITKISK